MSNVIQLRTCLHEKLSITEDGVQCLSCKDRLDPLTVLQNLARDETYKRKSIQRLNRRLMQLYQKSHCPHCKKPLT